MTKGEIRLSPIGQIAHQEWFKTCGLRKEIELFENEFVIMPHHIHGIVWIMESHGSEALAQNDRATGRLPGQEDLLPGSGPRPRSLSSFIGGYKSSVSLKANRLRNTPGHDVWVPNFHDRIIRNDREPNAIRQYILNNPLRWELDRFWQG
jgi:putative transposase